MPRSLNSSLMKPLVVLALPGMYLAYKIGEYKRHQQEQHRRKVTERELTHLNHKIDKLLNKLEEHEPEMASSQDEECVICINAKATMQTFPCGHRVVCRKCFVKTIQMAVSQRLLPLRCVVCRTKILRLKQSGSPNCPAPTPVPPGALPLRSSPTLQRMKRLDSNQHLCVLHNHDRHAHTRVTSEEATTVATTEPTIQAPQQKSTRYRSGGRYKSNRLFTILEKEEAEQADAAIRNRMPVARNWVQAPGTPERKPLHSGAPPTPSWRTAPAVKRNANGFKSYPRGNSEHRSKSSSVAKARLQQQQQKAIRVVDDEDEEPWSQTPEEVDSPQSDKPDPWRLASATLQERSSSPVLTLDKTTTTFTMAEIHAIPGPRAAAARPVVVAPIAEPEETPAKNTSAKIANKVSPLRGGIASEVDTITTLEKTIEVVRRPAKDIAKVAAAPKAKLLLPPPPPGPSKKISEVRKPSAITSAPQEVKKSSSRPTTTSPAESQQKKNRRRASNLEFWKKSPSKVQPVSEQQASPPPLEDSWGVSPRRFAGLLSPGSGNAAGYEKLDSSPSRKSPSRSFLARNYEKLEAWTRGSKTGTGGSVAGATSDACWGVSPFTHAGYEKLDSWSPSSQPKNLARAKISPLVSFQQFRHRSSVKAFRFK